MTPSRGAVVDSLLQLVDVALFIIHLTSFLKGYTNILFLSSGDRKINRMLLSQPWPVTVVTCKSIKIRVRHVTPCRSQ